MQFTSATDSLARRTGGAVILFFTTALVVTLLVTGIESRQFRHWKVYGTFESGLSGLKPGSVVRVGGAPMGEVTSIEIDRAVRPREVVEGEVPLAPSTGGFLVHFELDAEVELRMDAQIVLDQNALSGLAELDILSVGGGRSAPIPGPLPRSAQRAAPANPRRPFTFSSRGDAATRVLGKSGARDWAKIRSHLPGIEAIFFDSSGTHGELAGDHWGPVRESRIGVLAASVQPLLREWPADRDAWGEAITAIQSKWTELSNQPVAAEGQAPKPLERIDQLRAAFGAEHGLRAIWNQLSKAFAKPQSSWEAMKQCFGPAFAQGSLIASTFRALSPEIRDGLLVTKTGFAIGVTELWIMMGPELMTSLIRAVQPFSAAQENALVLILAANRAAESAESLRAAIDAARAAAAEGGDALAPATADRLARAVAPALERYRRDLSDLMELLQAAAAGSR